MTRNNSDLRDVCYEQIKDNFYYGLYGDFRLVIDKNTGYFNATKLCNESNKRYRNWARSERAHSLFDYHKNTQSYEIRLTNNNTLNKQITGQYLPVIFFEPIIHWMTSLQNLIKEGFVYVVTTSHLKSKNIYKISFTKNFQQGLYTFNRYRHSSEPQYFIVSLYSTSNARELERTVHRKLANYRDEHGFFMCDIDTISKTFKSEECTLEPYNYDEDF